MLLQYYVLFLVQLNSLTLVKAAIQIQKCKWPSYSAPKSSPVRHQMNWPLQTSHNGSAIVRRNTVSRVLTRTNMKNCKHVATTPHSSISHPKTTKISVTVTATVPLRPQQPWKLQQVCNTSYHRSSRERARNRQTSATTNRHKTHCSKFFRKSTQASIIHKIRKDLPITQSQAPSSKSKQR